MNRRQLITGVTVATLAWVLLELALPLLGNSANVSGHWESPLQVIVLGAITGMTYGLLGVGLVLIYRSNRIINFAHGQIGAFGAAVFGLMVTKGHVPYWVALVPALLATAAVGGLAEAAVIRRLRKAPPLMSIVATLGVGQFLLLFALVFNKSTGAGALFPQPPGIPRFHVGHLTITPAYLAILVLSPVIVIAVALFLKLSKYGLMIRCAASNPENARMTGIFAGRMSGLAWALAAAVAGFSAILAAPTQPAATGESFGPSLLLRALVAAVVARMSSLPIALGTGVVLGVAEQLLLLNYPNSGFVEIALFVAIVGALVLQRQRVGRAEEKGSWAAVQPLRPLPAALRQVWVVRRLGLLVGVTSLAVFTLLPLVISSSDSVTITGIFAFIIVGLSVGIVTGLGGQLSLGQFAIAGCGAIVSYQTVRRSGSYFEGFAYAGATSAAVAVLIGIPALRIKGLLLTVTTLSFALVVPAYVLNRPWSFAGSPDPGRPIVLGHAASSSKAYYFVGLAVLLVAMLIARNVRSSGLGRLLVSVRDNEDAARAFTVSATRVKITGFAAAGFIAGIGGAMYAHSLSLVDTGTFPTQTSIAIVTMTVIGGVGLLSGPLLGSLVVFFIPDFVPLGSTGLATTAFGQLLIIMYLPGGLAQLVGPVRDRLASAIGRRAGIDVEAAFLVESSSGAAQTAPVTTLVRTTATTSDVHPRLPLPTASTHLLEAYGLRKSFGGVRAVRGVSFGVRPGETLGLIGPNGAGKTTTFELLAGFTRTDEGSVRFDGRDITALSPEARGKLGLIRSFQDAALFPTLSVTECVQLALERVEPTRIGPALAGLTRQERRKQETARELVAWMGLDRYRSAQIQELSTGTRRITEIACLVALQPRLLLLDEPSSGVAQRETEAMGALLEKLRAQLGLTLIIIEHDIPLIMGISDRIVAMADGEVIAAGTPEAVRHDPAVVDAYLGGSLTAIERSGPGDQPAAPTRKRPLVTEGALA